MKSFQSRLSDVAPFVFFPILIILKKKKGTLYAFILTAVISLSSCYLNFFRTNSRQSIDAVTLSRLKSENKYFIVHFSNSTNGLEEAYLDHDTLHGKLVTLSRENSKYLHPNSEEKNRYKKADKDIVLMEVHLYTAGQKKNGDSLLAANVSSFNKADIYELNKSATNSNHIWSTVGIALTAVFIIGTIAAATAVSSINSSTGDCNCPQVYMDNAGKYSFASGLYSGAVYSTLERTDYLPLKDVAADAKDISFKIANAKNEEQFINTVQLMQVLHSPDVNVLPDRHGNIFSYSKAAAPLSAAADRKTDIINLLKKTDESYYSFDSNSNEDGLSDVLLTFDKPENTDKAKLVIHGRNTQWGGLLHKEFISLFGDNFEKWSEKQEKTDPKKLEKWQTDQALPLMVYLKTSTGWKFVDYFPLIGNTATRDMIMEINTAGISDDKIELKLETAYRFWDLDYAGVDWSKNDDFKTAFIQPEKALLSDNTDQTNALNTKDNQYVHLTGDEAINCKYSLPSPGSNNIASYILVSGGYYHNLEHITGKTNYIELYKFKKKGAFDKFSRQKFREAQDVAKMIKDIN